MVALRDSGSAQASLGVVSVLEASRAPGDTELPFLARTCLLTAPRLVGRFYNFQGLATFRKRFNPERWQDIFLCIQRRDQKTLSSWNWIQVFIGIFRAFRPRVRFSASAIGELFAGPLRKHPVSITVGAISLVLFATINHFGELPAWALSDFSFDPKAPFLEWFYRTFTSDFLYFDRGHFAFCTVPLLGLILWAEKTHSKRFVIGFVLLTSFLDDFLNYGFIVKPFQYFQPHIFPHLIAAKDVGGSLWLANLLGLQLCRFKKNREILFAVICLVSVFGFVYSIEHMKELILNLNHFLFLSIGYITGKVLFERERAASRAVAKAKPPVAKCVASRIESPRVAHEEI